MDDRLRCAILKIDAKHKSFEDICAIAVMDAAHLISAIGDRAITSGLDGNKKNYLICQRIARMRIALDQMRLIFATDNIDTFERSMMRDLENTVRTLRAAEIPPRKDWHRCIDCKGLVHPRKSQDSIPDGMGGRMYRCHKCID